MVLSSQIARSNSIRSRVTVRHRRKSKVRWLVALAVLLGIVWFAWPGDDEGEFASPPMLAGDMNPSGDAVGNVNGNANGQVPQSSIQQASLLSPLSSANPTRLPNTGNADSAQGNTGQGNTALAARDGAVRQIEAGVPVFETPGPAQPGAVGSTNGVTLKGAPPFETDNPGNPSNGAGGQPTLEKLIPNIGELLRQVTFTSTGDARSELRRGMQLIEVGKFVEGRKVLSKVLTAGGGQLSELDAQSIRDTLASVNKTLVFSNRVFEGDPLVEKYQVKSGDLLGKISRRYAVTYQLLETINKVKANRIQIGQKLKVIKGPFHVVISKTNYRMDLFLNDPDGTPIYVRSFWVGLGKDNGTPSGAWICKNGGKLSNPSWRHPRTNKYFAANDPKNPIGEYWIALQGTDANTKGRSGYGIHGTIEPESIGKQMSLGCVRMLPGDIKQTYYLLVDGKSTVLINR